MSWDLIKSIQKKTDLRLILPFGLSVKLGDVISVGKDGNFTLEGACKTLLGMSAGRTRQSQNAKVDLMVQSGKDAKYAFRTAGTASTLFPQLPAAKAGFDVSFGKADSWILALKGRTIESLDELNRFRLPILSAYQRGVWKTDWALIVSIAKVDRMTLLAASSSNTKVSLSVGANMVSTASLEAKLTSDVTIMATNQELVHCITRQPTVAFCTGLQVRDSFWRGYEIGNLGTKSVDVIPTDKARDIEFWEDMDDF